MIVFWWVVLSCLVAGWAGDKGRSRLYFLLLSLILSPVVGAIGLLIAGDNKDKLDEEAVSDGKMRKCPGCAETIRAEASKCRYCGTSVTPTDRGE